MMEKEEYIDQRVAAYSEVFDFYMDCGQLPDMVQDGDLLAGYMKSVIDANPQLDSQDNTWKEVLKDDLLAFLSALLGAFFEIEQAHQKETELIELYQKSDIEQQRQLWASVYKQIKGCYPATDVNIDGYIKQFADNETQDVIDALAQDWKKAADKRLNQQEEHLLEQNKDRWERRMREYGRTDYERRKKIDRMYYRYPVLQEIVRIIGREQPQRKDEKDDIVFRYMPALLSYPMKTTEIEQISIGNDLSHVVPTEIATLSEPVTEMMFFKKFAERQLQVFANKPPMETQDKQVQEHQTKAPPHHKSETELYLCWRFAICKPLLLAYNDYTTVAVVVLERLYGVAIAIDGDAVRRDALCLESVGNLHCTLLSILLVDLGSTGALVCITADGDAL